MGEIVRQNMPEIAVKELLLESAARSNILPVISTCNVGCKFCSHGQNPPAAEVLKMPAITMKLADEALSLMDPGKPVVIGESVTRLIEGEPFTHPRIKDILRLIRRKMPHAQIRLTTNGTMLDRETLDFLASLGNVMINLSLNSADVSVRKYLMNDARAERAVAAPVLLQERSIAYHGSVVAMPHLTGWEDLANTLAFLDRHGAATVRVFLPGHTRLAPPALRIPRNLKRKLNAFLAAVRSGVKTPITLEPPVINNLLAEVAGVMVNSPAHRAGVKAGDIIAGVDGMPVQSRVDAFKRVLDKRNPSLAVYREGTACFFRIEKEKGRPSGLVFDFDLDPAMIREIFRAVERRRAKSPLLLTSELGYPAVKMGLKKLFPGESPAIR
ncbi:MAG: radical SAM protein, partial [Peptococcaceae bacterium]|nr:radical SAM protein [Peptococcaceae bacterium]